MIFHKNKYYNDDDFTTLIGEIYLFSSSVNEDELYSLLRETVKHTSNKLDFYINNRLGYLLVVSDNEYKDIKINNITILSLKNKIDKYLLLV